MNETLICSPQKTLINPRLIFSNWQELTDTRNEDGSWTVIKDKNYWFQYGSDWMAGRYSGDRLKRNHCALFDSTTFAYTGFYKESAWIKIHGISGTLTNIWIQWWGTLAQYHADVGTKLLLTSGNNSCTIEHIGHAKIQNGNGNSYCTYSMSNPLEIDTELLMEIKEYSGSSEGNLYCLIYNIVFELEK